MWEVASQIPIIQKIMPSSLLNFYLNCFGLGHVTLRVLDVVSLGRVFLVSP